MHDHAEIAERLRWANPVGDPADPPSGAVSADIALLEIERRSTTVQTQEHTTIDETPKKRRLTAAWAAAAAFVAVVAVVALAVLVNSNQTDRPTATTEPTTTTETPVTTTLPEAQASDAMPLTKGFGSIENGTHRPESFGTPITFVVESSAFFVQENRTGFFAISAANSREPDDRDLVITLLSGLPEPSAPATAGTDWPVEDFAGWLDTLAASVVVTERLDTTVGGLAAIRVDLECTEGATSYCLVIDSGRRKFLDPNDKYRMWVVQRGSEAPIVLIVGTSGNVSDEAWRDALEQVALSITFED